MQKKYEQAKQQKRDYMLQGIMNLKKKSDQESSGIKIRATSKESNGSSRSKGSQRQQDSKRDIYRKVETVDRNRYQQDQLNRNASNKQLQIQSRQVKRLSGNFKSSDNLHNLQTQTYRNQQPMVRESDKNANPVSYQNKSIKHYTANSYSSSQYNLSNNNGSGNNNIENPVNSQTSLQTPNYSSKYQNIISSPKNSVQSNYSNQPQVQNQYSYPNQTQSGNAKTQSNYQGISQNQMQRNTHTQNKSNYITYESSNKNNNPSTQIVNKMNYQSNTNTNLNLNNIGNQNPANLGQFQQVKKNIMENNLAVQVKIQAQQNQFLKSQLDRLIQQNNDIRNKFYKSEEQKSSIKQKNKMLQFEKNDLKRQNQQLKLKLKNLQFQIETLNSHRVMSENQIRELKGNKQMVNNDMMNKINQVTAEFRKKTLQVTNYQRLTNQLQSQLKDNSYEIKRLTEIVNKKDQQIANLQQLKYQINNISTVQGRNQFEIKSLQQRVSTLDNQNKILREQKVTIPRLETQISKYRKKIEQMLQDMKDLQVQIQQKQKIINQYKNMSFNQFGNNQIKALEQQIKTILEQKSQMAKNYEHRLLQKDKKISQLQVQQYQKTNNLSSTKLGGMQAGEAAFQEILQTQIQQINILKRQNTTKVNELFTTKIQLQNLKSELQNQTNKNKILAMQMQSNEKNSQSSAESHLRAAKSQIESLNRRIQNLNNTIESKRKQNQNKDEFIKNYIIGTNKQAEAGVLLSNLQKILNRKT